MNEVAWLLTAFVSLVLLFAQLKMFSVDTTLREISAELKRLHETVEKLREGQRDTRERATRD